MKQIYPLYRYWNNTLSLFWTFFFLSITAHATIAPDTEINAALSPNGIKARASLVGAITVEWEAVPGATAYTIAYSFSEGNDFQELETIEVNASNASAGIFSYRDTGLGYNETYYYKVKAITNAGETAYSASAKATTHAENRVFKIMPLGDSNTQGSKSGDTRPESEKIAYRKQLYDLLVNAKAKIDYVGSEKSGSSFLADDEHAGFSGSRVMDILSLLKTSSYKNQASVTISRGANGPYLDTYQPDIILLHIGTNGGLYGVSDDEKTIAEIGQILDEVDLYEQRAQKEVTVILARIINRIPQNESDQSPAYTSRYNDKMAALAQKRINERSDRVIVVDMEREAGLIYKFEANGGDMSDYLHPEPSGFRKMANTWFGALKSLLEPASVDTRAPETTITSKPAANSSNNTATFEFSSNESRVTYQVSLNGAAFANAANPYTVTALADGAHTLSVRAVDAAGNIDATPATYTWVVDTKAPEAPVMLSIAEDRGPEKEDLITSDNTLSFSGTAEINALVTVIEKTKGTLGTTQANATGNWTFSYENTALPEGTYTFTATATDAAGNTSPASKDLVVQIDLTAPTVAIASEVSGAVNKAFNISIKFSEETYGLDAAKFTITNGALSNLASTDKVTYTATITPAAGGQGKITVILNAGKVTDLAGNENSRSNQFEVSYDFVPPKVTLTSEAPAFINAPFTVKFTFDEAVTGFEIEDIGIVNGRAGNLVATSPSVYTVLISPAAEGEVSVRLAADKAFDLAGNGNTLSDELKRIYDVQPPTVTLTTDAAEPTNKGFTITIAVSEPVTGFETGDIKVSNGTASRFTKVDNTTFTVFITPMADGEVVVAVEANKMQDAASNGNIAANPIKRVYDATRPAIEIHTEAPELTNAPFTAVFNFSEDVEGFVIGDITAGNAVAGNFIQVTKRQYTLLITPVADGEVTVSVAAGVAIDAATNENTASNMLRRRYDGTAPAGYAVMFDTERVDLRNQENIALTITGAEVGAVYFYAIVSTRGGEPISGTATTTASSFKISPLNLSALLDGTLRVTFYQVDEAKNRGLDATAEVIKITKDIASVKSIETIRVPFKTNFTRVPLPGQMEVTYTNGEKQNLTVTWLAGNYNPEIPGTYTVTGELTLVPNTTNLNEKVATVMIEVESNKPPTALNFSSTTFKPDADPSDIIGTFTTVDPDDSEHAYELVNGEGDDNNELFELSGDKLHLKSNRGLVGKLSFTIRIRSTDPYENTIERSFTLTKSKYQSEKKLKLVNAFSPDNDGINDTWTVPELRFYNDIEIQVFDRSGVRLFHTKNPEEGWDGRGQNGQVKQGSYFYIIEVKDINLVQKGVVTILK